MRRGFLLLLVAVLAALAVSDWLGTEPGYVYISLAGYSIEMTAWTGLVLILVLALAVSAVTRLRAWLRHRRRPAASTPRPRPARDLTTRAAAHFIAGDWQRAERQLLRAARKSEAPALNYLLAARASHEAGDDGRAETHLLKAEQQGQLAAVPALLTRAELLLQSGRAAQARDLLDKLPARDARHPVAQRLYVEALRDLNDWQALLARLPAAKRQKALSASRLDELERQACHGLLEAADGVDALRSLWRQLPEDARADAEFATRYCNRLAAGGAVGEALIVVKDRLKQQWQAPLVRLYGLLQGDDPAAQLRVAEGWQRKHPNDATLLLSLGRLCLANRLWGKARDYLEASVAEDPALEACAELARYYDSIGEHVRSSQLLQRGLSHNAVSLPALPMPERAPD